MFYGITEIKYRKNNKFKQIGPTNWIVYDSDSDDDKFRSWFLSVSKSDDQIKFQF